jgi:phage tail sheath gpL-like
MKKSTSVSLVRSFKVTAAAALISLFSITNSQAQDTKGQAVMSSTTMTAKVIQVNQKTREVTVKLDNGEEYSFIAGDEVKNLAQLKKGDIITAVYTEAIAYEIKEHGTAGVKTTTASQGAPAGSKPAGIVAQQTTVTVLITAIDPKAPTVTFMGPRGNKETIKVRDPKNLNGVKVGDKVDITYTEALAIKVDEAPKK